MLRVVLKQPLHDWM